MGNRKILAEFLEGTQVSLVHKIQNTPVLTQAVFNGGTTHGDADARLDFLDRLGLGRCGIFNILGLVDHDHGPVSFGEGILFATHYAVGGQYQIGFFEFDLTTVRAVIDVRFQAGREAGNFLAPVGE